MMGSCCHSCPPHFRGSESFETRCSSFGRCYGRAPRCPGRSIRGGILRRWIDSSSTRSAGNCGTPRRRCICGACFPRCGNSHRVRLDLPSSKSRTGCSGTRCSGDDCSREDRGHVSCCRCGHCHCALSSDSFANGSSGPVGAREG